jgi:hypothetical protein
VGGQEMGDSEWIDKERSRDLHLSVLEEDPEERKGASPEPWGTGCLCSHHDRRGKRHKLLDQGPASDAGHDSVW